MNRITRFCLAFIVLFEAQLSNASSSRQKRGATCGKRFHEAPGVLRSPSYPDQYPSDTDCQWTISTTEGKILSIKFLVFSFENHDSCNYDYLEIYDGDSSNAKKLGRFCGNELPGKFVSSGSKLFVVFHSDPAVEGKGFEMKFSTSYGCDRVFTEDSGEILSPNFPGQHPQPMQCYFHINVSEGKTIRLTFEEFSLEGPSVKGCEYDYVEVFDGPTVLFPRLGKFCGDHKPSVKASRGSQLLVRFVADSTVIKTGFRIKYYAKETSMNEICNRPAYTGDCRAAIERWFYNTQNKKCERFTYGGCNSNGNNFRTKNECARQCQGKVSTDFNECSVRNGGCDQACHNTLGSYFCSCWKGYRIGEDQRTCVDVNECALGRNIHHCEQNCTNMPGSYYCSCQDGFQLSANRRTCNDINECLFGGGGGGACHQACVNTPGSFKCECFKGFEPHPGRPKRCRDINECDLNLPDCHKCSNFEGGYRCECDKGFTLSDNETSCVDNNECLDNNGGCSQLCINKPGTHACRCKEGFAPIDPIKSIDCEDIDECAGNNGKGNCSHQCTNSVGSFNCSCPQGYYLTEDRLTCADINECLDNNGGCTQKCVNLPSSYKCACHDGFEEIGKNGTDVVCRDIDECFTGTHECDRDLGALCVNEIGNYSCLCPPGYYSDWNNCIDVDECDISTINNCQQQCNNTPGSFHCTCLKGFSLNNDSRTCRDIDECAVSPCDHHCLNGPGSFVCLCNQGFFLDKDNTTCLDVNECDEDNGFCEQICVNTNGSHKCECHSGYRLREGGRACQDIDECSTGTACCDSICSNEQGGYSCSCQDGHFLSRDNCTCQDTDECAVNNGGCDHICNNTKGGFSCSCRPGYEVDPTNSSRCLDINECSKENGGCSQICNNTEGSYECHCKPVYKLGPDGKTCDHCPTCENFEALINIIEKLQMEVQELKRWKSEVVKKSVRSGSCQFKDTIYEDGKHWQDGDCRRCYCQKGQILCFQDKKCFQSDFPLGKTSIPSEPGDSPDVDGIVIAPPSDLPESMNADKMK